MIFGENMAIHCPVFRVILIGIVDAFNLVKIKKTNT